MKVKIVDNGYILGVAIASMGTEITEQEYAELTDLFHNMPTAREGYEYKLTEDHKWVEVELQDSIDDTESLSIMLGEETE